MVGDKYLFPLKNNGGGGGTTSEATYDDLGLIKLGTDTKATEEVEEASSEAGRQYPIQLDNDGRASVNVPWTDTTYESKPAAQDGTDESLVTTGEKYTWGQKQDALVNQVNIKSVNGNSLLGSGDVDIRTYQAFPNTWVTNTTTKAFCASVDADGTAGKGMAYLGELRCSDLPANLVNGEAIVEIIEGTGTSNKVVHVILTSGNRYPYRWEYTYWNNGRNVSGWIAFQPLVEFNTAYDASTNKAATMADIANAVSGMVTQSQVVERVNALPTADATTADFVQLSTGVMYQKEYVSGTYSYELVDTTYESEPAAQGGTDESLVTTGEKYIWNNKLDNAAMVVDWE